MLLVLFFLVSITFSSPSYFYSVHQALLHNTSFKCEGKKWKCSKKEFVSRAKKTSVQNDICVNSSLIEISVAQSLNAPISIKLS